MSVQRKQTAGEKYGNGANGAYRGWQGTSVSGVVALALLSHVLIQKAKRAKLRLRLYVMLKRWSAELCS